MALIFPKWTNELPRMGAPLLAVVGGFVVFAVWYWMSPLHTDVGYQPRQPIPYSHKLHAGELGLDCRYCHNNVERSPNAGVPPTQTCMNCHKQVKVGSPRLLPLMESWGDGKPGTDGGPVPWKRVHKISDYAYFTHSAHTAIITQGVAVGCKTCHGRIDEMVVVRQVEPLSMSWCLDCHNNPAPNLRPIGELTNMAWEPDAAWLAKAEEIAKHLDPPGNKHATSTLPDGQVVTRSSAGCTGCHR